MAFTTGETNTGSNISPLSGYTIWDTQGVDRFGYVFSNSLYARAISEDKVLLAEVKLEPGNDVFFEINIYPDFINKKINIIVNISLEGSSFYRTKSNISVKSDLVILTDIVKTLKFLKSDGTDLVLDQFVYQFKKRPLGE